MCVIKPIVTLLLSNVDTRQQVYMIDHITLAHRISRVQDFFSRKLKTDVEMTIAQHLLFYMKLRQHGIIYSS
jgi:hypothetical protein